MSDNLREFEMALKRMGDEVPAAEVEKLHRAVQLEALSGVVLATPVDTGRARGAWELTIGTPSTSEGGALDRTGGATIARGLAVIGQIKAFSLSWLTNRVPYIVRLEDGSSKQAPNGMVARTLSRLRAMFA